MGKRAMTAGALSAVVVLIGCAGQPQNQNDDGDTVPAPDITSTPAESDDPQAPDADPLEDPNSAATPSPTPEPEPQRASEASGDPASIHVLVNRRNPLDPVDYRPEDLVVPQVRTTIENEALLRAEPAEALEALFAAASEQGVSLGMTSAFRSFEQQSYLYTSWESQLGTAATDDFAARPGYSEHQTGLAADVIGVDNPECNQGECFDQTPEGQWVAENAPEFGFIIRYPEDMEHITGYPYEPWHLRYVGEETAAEVADEHLTLEEYWEQPDAPDYEDPSQEPGPEGPPAEEAR